MLNKMHPKFDLKNPLLCADVLIYKVLAVS